MGHARSGFQSIYLALRSIIATRCVWYNSFQYPTTLKNSSASLCLVCAYLLCVCQTSGSHSIFYATAAGDLCLSTSRTVGGRFVLHQHRPDNLLSSALNITNILMFTKHMVRTADFSSLLYPLLFRCAQNFTSTE